MHLSALHHAGPLLDLTTTAKRMGVASSSDVAETDNTFQEALTVGSAGTTTVSDSLFPAAASANPAAQVTPDSTMADQQSTSNQASATGLDNANTGSLLNALKSYTSASQGSSQAYQEYAKAWGGRVVHGEVELPPLSIYLE